VRVQALDTLLTVSEMLHVDTRRQRVLPLLREMMHPLDMEPPMHRAVARNFGRILHVVGGHVTS
jgi:hypothetical protein